MDQVKFNRRMNWIVGIAVCLTVLTSGIGWAFHPLTVLDGAFIVWVIASMRQVEANGKN